MLQHNDPDIVCLTETHLKGAEVISLSSFDYVVSNRVEKRKCRKGSGGIGIMINRRLKVEFEYAVCFQFEDTILGVEFKNKYNNEQIVLFCVYLPPEGSVYAQNNEQALNMLTIELYKYNLADGVFTRGDFNARIGEMLDNRTSLDLPTRIVIDKTVNAQGTKLMNFTIWRNGDSISNDSMMYNVTTLMTPSKKNN